MWRELILEHCDGSETETIALAKKDSEGPCRAIAFSKVKFLSPKEFKNALNCRDEHILRGLLENRSLFIASRVASERLVSWEQLKELGSEKWIYQDSHVYYEFEKIVGRGGCATLKQMIFNWSRYRWEKKYPINVFRALRNKAWDQIKDFDRIGTNFDWQFRQLSEGLQKRFPPVNSEHLFSEDEYGGDNFVGHKIDFIAKRLCFYGSLLERGKKLLKRTFFIVIVIWVAWKLFEQF